MSCGSCGSPKEDQTKEKKEMCPCGCGKTVDKCSCPPDCTCHKDTCK